MPKRRITPRWGWSRPDTARRRVDLPAPFVPSRATISPAAPPHHPRAGAPHPGGADHEQEATHRTDGGDEGECHHDPMQSTDRVGNGTEDHRPGEAPEDK